MKRKRYLEINLLKEPKDLYSEHYKALMKKKKSKMTQTEIKIETVEEYSPSPMNRLKKKKLHVGQLAQNNY